MSRTNRLLIAAACVLIACALGLAAWYRWKHRAPPPQPAAAQTAVSAAPAAGGIEHPLPDAASGKPPEPLPKLGESDAPLRAQLALAVGEQPLAAWLVPDNLVRNIVVTVDNLPRRRIAERMRPLGATAGSPIVTRVGSADQERITLDEQNFARYAPLVTLVQNTDMQRLAEVYVRYYPLFQEQYEQLGFPGKYFNDRAVVVIDDLLAAPDLHGPVELVQPNVLYEFAEPQLEARSAGQKTMMRIGPANAAIVKAKLKELRAAIAQRRAPSPPRTP